MQTGELVLAILTFVAIVVALILGVTNIRQTQRIQTRQHKLTLSDEIIEWAIKIRRCGSEIGFLSLAAKIEEEPWGGITLSKVQISLRDIQQKGKYVVNIAKFLEPTLHDDINKLMNLVNEYLSELEGLFISIKLGAVQGGPLEDVLKPLIEKPSLVEPASDLIEKVVKVKTDLLQS